MNLIRKAIHEPWRFIADWRVQLVMAVYFALSAAPRAIGVGDTAWGVVYIVGSAVLAVDGLCQAGVRE